MTKANTMAWLLLLAPAVATAQTGIITTLAGATPVDGDPVRGFSGDLGPGVLAAIALATVQNGCDPNRYERISHLSVDTKGNVFFVAH